MATAAHLLRLNAADLLRHPGATRLVEVDLSAAELEIDDARVAGDVSVAATATSTIDGVSIHGTIRTPWQSECRRCLVEVAGIAESVVDELFQQHPRDTDTLAMTGDQIDLAPLVREYVLLDLPEAPLCRLDCAGICPVCGADRNVDPCRCDDGPIDIRWSGLRGLPLPDEPS
jgi:uncharacterized protein